MENYEDIIGLPHHQSSRRPHMSMESRAAQFLPFAALTGYDAAISEAGRLTEDFSELDEDQKAVLDAKLHFLEGMRGNGLEVTIRYFEPDIIKEGGSYREAFGVFRKVDPVKKTVILEGNEGISLERIVDIQLPGEFSEGGPQED